MADKDIPEVSRRVGIEPYLIVGCRKLQPENVPEQLIRIALNEESLDLLFLAGTTTLFFEAGKNTHVAERTVQDLFIRRHACSGLELLTIRDRSAYMRFCPRRNLKTGDLDITFRENGAGKKNRQRRLHMEADGASVRATLAPKTKIVAVTCVGKAAARRLRDKHLFDKISTAKNLQVREAALLQDEARGPVPAYEIHDPQTGLTFTLRRTLDKYEVGIPVDFEADDEDFNMPLTLVDSEEIAQYVLDAVEVARLARNVDEKKEQSATKAG
ncbi:MAG: hypothetical protein ACYTDY_11050 [Planctomycetota bacterium]|jgi:hypothetical protein